jgi:hypothetical protein
MAEASDDETDVNYAWDPKSDPDGYASEDVFATDMALDTVLTVFGGDAGASSIQMTFVVGGVIISGTVITRDAWQRIAADAFASSGASPEVAKGIDHVWSRYHEGIEEEKERRAEAHLPPARDLFFHMRDARVGGPGGMIAPIWRGLRSEVTGWTLGSPS